MTHEQQDELFKTIARRHLGLDALAVRHADRLDFHELAVWQLEAALRAAYDAGREAGGEPPSPPAGKPTEQ